MVLSLSILRRALFIVSLSVMCASVVILVRECPLCVCVCVCFGLDHFVAPAAPDAVSPHVFLYCASGWL
jgi:hypothetical protein